MIDHLGLGVRDGAASKRFYTEALKPLGIGVIMEFGDSVGMGTEGKPFFWFRPGGELVPLHIAFAAQNRAAVDAFHRAALAAGGQDNGPPGLRTHYHPNYYGAFVIDPDGNNIEAVCHTAPGAAPARASRPTARKTTAREAAARKTKAKPVRRKAAKPGAARKGRSKSKKSAKGRSRR